MSTVLDQPLAEETEAPVERLRATMAAVRVSITWLGVRKSLSAEQKRRAAESFGAEGDVLSAGKKLIDTSHPAYKSLTRLRNQIGTYWKGLTLPYPENGIRLIRQDNVSDFSTQMEAYQLQLQQAEQELNRSYAELLDSARDRLGTLFNEDDYPVSLEGLFDVRWDFPSVEPPDYLQQLNPQLYQQECQRMQNRFRESVRLAEEAFIAELGKLVSHLTERLSGAEDGKPKVFRDSAMENLNKFFERFRSLNVSSSQELDSLVDQVRLVVQGVRPQDLRDQQSLRRHVATELSAAQSVLDGLLVDRPRRNILRRAK